jgi:hypothetical protein
MTFERGPEWPGPIAQGGNMQGSAQAVIAEFQQDWADRQEARRVFGMLDPARQMDVLESDARARSAALADLADRRRARQDTMARAMQGVAMGGLAVSALTTAGLGSLDAIGGVAAAGAVVGATYLALTALDAAAEQRGEAKRRILRFFAGRGVEGAQADVQLFGGLSRLFLARTSEEVQMTAADRVAYYEKEVGSIELPMSRIMTVLHDEEVQELCLARPAMAAFIQGRKAQADALVHKRRVSLGHRLDAVKAKLGLGEDVNGELSTRACRDESSPKARMLRMVGAGAPDAQRLSRFVVEGLEPQVAVDVLVRLSAGSTLGGAAAEITALCPPDELEFAAMSLAGSQREVIVHVVEPMSQELEGTMNRFVAVLDREGVKVGFASHDDERELEQDHARAKPGMRMR